jgi:hypothetical protein
MKLRHIGRHVLRRPSILLALAINAHAFGLYLPLVDYRADTHVPE